MKAARAQRRFRAYAHIGITTLVVLVFAFVEWWVEKSLSSQSRVASTAVELAVVLAAALVFRPIHQRVEGSIEAAFTKRKREAQAALAHLRAELTSFNDTSQLLRRAIEAVHHHTGAGGCAVYLHREGYRAEASSFDVAAPPVPDDDPLAVRLRSTAAPADPRALHSAAMGALAFPMTAAGELVGFLTIAVTHEDVEPDELAALATFAEATGLALLAVDPQLRSDKGGARKHNLPAGLAPLIGRDEELVEIGALLDRSRLVTLTGAGGIGKTRIALEIAAGSIPQDGAWFVDLAPLEDPTLVATAVAHAFNLADEGGSRPLIDRLARTLERKHLLIVLDNCEHVITSAAHVAAHLLKACPGLRILATSREPLGIAGEESYRLPSLPVPPEGEAVTAQSVLGYSAAALFAERARSAQRSFEVNDENAPIIADIVRRLDGIALAIELAAPRVKLLSLAQIDRRLDERFTLLRGGSRVAQPRHQTLRALIGWSYDLLTAPEQRLLRRSAIFRGSWTLEALEAVSDAGEADVLETLLALVDKSLIVVEAEGDDRRYRLLESTRAFVADQLDAADERESAAALHAAFFYQAALSYGETYWQTDSHVWARHVRRDLENMRAAISWGLTNGDAAAVAVTAALRWFWYIGSRREGGALLERAHELPASTLPGHVRGLLALCAATLDYSAQAVLPASEASHALRGVDDLGYAEALTFEGIALGRGGRVPEAIAFFEDALVAARATRMPRLLGWVLSMVAYWMGAARDTARARDLFDEASELLRSCNDGWQLARLQLHRAEFLFAQGDADGALKCAREAEAVFRERSGDGGLCISVLNAAAYLIALGRFEDAWNCAQEGLDLGLRLDTSMPVAWAIGHLARLAAETGDPERAARLLGYADEAYRVTASARESTEQSGYDRTLERIRITLPPERVTALMAEGAALEDAVAVSHARAVPQPRESVPATS
jgi:predicted ATPase